jgi:excisionase family DNA binding protein
MDEAAVSLPRLWTIAEVAEALNTCSETIRRAIWDGKLPAVRIGRAVRLEPAAVRAYIASLPTNANLGRPRRW